MTVSRMAVIFLITLLIAACDAGNRIVITTYDGTVIANFMRDMIVLRDRPTKVCINEFRLYRADPIKIIWELESADGKCVDAQRILIGVTPTGMRAKQPFRGLIKGATYRIGVKSSEGMFGSEEWRMP